MEDADKSFLNEIIKEEDEQEEKGDDSIVQSIKRDELEKEVAEAVDEILEEARIETSKRPNSKSKQFENSDLRDEPNNKFANKEASNSLHSRDKQVPRVGPPSVPPPPPPVPAVDDNKFEANFEANFDDAFGEPEQHELPKQLGGRASIPDELAPHQLECLQNLKESNA